MPLQPSYGQSFSNAFVWASSPILRSSSKSVITNQTIKSRMVDVVEQLPTDSFCFELGDNNPEHIKWAILLCEAGVWSIHPPNFDGDNEKWVDFAVKKTRNGMAEVKEDQNLGLGRVMVSRATSPIGLSSNPRKRTRHRPLSNNTSDNTIGKQADGAGPDLNEIQQRLETIKGGYAYTIVLTNMDELFHYDDNVQVGENFDHAWRIGCSPVGLANTVFLHRHRVRRASSRGPEKNPILIEPFRSQVSTDARYLSEESAFFYASNKMRGDELQKMPLPGSSISERVPARLYEQMARDEGNDSEGEEDDGQRDEYAGDMEYDYGNGEEKLKGEYLPRLDEYVLEQWVCYGISLIEGPQEILQTGIFNYGFNRPRLVRVKKHWMIGS